MMSCTTVLALAASAASASRALPSTALPRHLILRPRAFPRATAAAGVDLDFDDEDAWADEGDDYLSQLKTGGTPEEERALEPPPGHTPFAARSDLDLGSVPAGLVPAEGTTTDQFDVWAQSLRRDTSAGVAQVDKVVLKGDQAHDEWLASLKTGGTPEQDRALEPPPGHRPFSGLAAEQLGLAADDMTESIGSTQDAWDKWMEGRTTGGTPEEERSLEPPPGYTPFNAAVAVGPVGEAGKPPVTKFGREPKPAKLRKPPVAADTAPPAPTPAPAPVVSAPAQPQPAAPEAVVPDTFRPPPPRSPAVPSRAEKRQAVTATTGGGASAPTPAAVGETLELLAAWIRSPAHERKTGDAARLCACVDQVTDLLGRPSSQLPLSAIDMPPAIPGVPKRDVPRPVPCEPLIGGTPRRQSQPTAPQPTPTQPPPAQPRRTTPLPPVPAVTQLQRAEAIPGGFDVEDVEPERLAYEGKDVEQLLGGRAQAVGASNDVSTAQVPISPSQAAAGGRTEIPINTVVDRAFNAQLPSQREELRGFASQYMVEGMERMTMAEYREAMDKKISATAKQWRSSRPKYGAVVVEDYMSSLSRPRDVDGDGGAGDDSQ